jgi:HAD superfamily hydrolase (TIGR01509 family)
VIFDCDGVLVDSEAIANRVLAEHVTAAGLPMTVAEARDVFLGKRWHEVVADVEERLGSTLPDNWWDRHHQEREKAFREELQAVPGVASVLDVLASAGVPCCVATQARLEKMEATLEITGLASYFPAATRFSADQVARGKPHPDVFLYAADQMGIAAASCVVVEDSPQGVTAAIHAGMRVLGYAPESDGEELPRAGARTFHDMAELPALFELL